MHWTRDPGMIYVAGVSVPLMAVLGFVALNVAICGGPCWAWWS